MTLVIYGSRFSNVNAYTLNLTIPSLISDLSSRSRGGARGCRSVTVVSRAHGASGNPAPASFSAAAAATAAGFAASMKPQEMSNTP